MQLLDVNVYVRAFNQADPDHVKFRDYVNGLLGDRRTFGYLDLSLSGFIRVVTTRRRSGEGLFEGEPISASDALAFTDTIRTAPDALEIKPGPRQWSIFSHLCRHSTQSVHGKLVPDAFLAAIAIENECEWVTADRDFRYFPGLRWRLLPEDQSFTNPT